MRVLGTWTIFFNSTDRKGYSYSFDGCDSDKEGALLTSHKAGSMALEIFNLNCPSIEQARFIPTEKEKP